MIRCLTWLFGVFDAPIAIYSDRKSFASAEMKAFLKTFGTIHIAAPVASHRSVGMAEKAEDLFQRVLKKGYGYWQFGFSMVVKALNSRVIDKVGYSPHEIFFGFPPGQVMDKFPPTINKLEIQSLLQLNV
ncbi:putative eka-like protein [Golovinomyces cichoracearum]|uniref:Putative eka-like protein n=1 Tax=Golovinomyces cichoracearum TaxID=62708 RepID=A0A420HLJ5_9PEZI|nr:putative eka-like protein [Golovinomyces cichoracearum]